MTERGIQPDDPVQTAEEAGLRYVSDQQPGITRRRSGRGFSYRGADGRPLRAKATLARIRALTIPPAWCDVWICPLEHGHIQATGRDARGRKQYRYHARWRKLRDENKYGRMPAFGRALPAIRRRVEHDLARRGLPREGVAPRLSGGLVPPRRGRPAGSNHRPRTACWSAGALAAPAAPARSAT